jgi:hypothetical protein
LSTSYRARMDDIRIAHLWLLVDAPVCRLLYAPLRLRPAVSRMPSIYYRFALMFLACRAHGPLLTLAVWGSLRPVLSAEP